MVSFFVHDNQEQTHTAPIATSWCASHLQRHQPCPSAVAASSIGTLHASSEVRYRMFLYVYVCVSMCVRLYYCTIYQHAHNILLWFVVEPQLCDIMIRAVKHTNVHTTHRMIMFHWMSFCLVISCLSVCVCVNADFRRTREKETAKHFWQDSHQSKEETHDDFRKHCCANSHRRRCLSTTITIKIQNMY